MKYTILKHMMVDQLRQDFVMVTKKTKEEFGIQLPATLSWMITLLFQNMLLLLFALVFESITDPQFKGIVIFIVLLFNLLLPGTMARQNANRISHHPIHECLWQTSINRFELLNVILLSEVLMFWLHELMLEIIAIYVLIRLSPDFISGLLLILIWLLFISTIYYVNLKKEVLKSWGLTITDSKPEFHHLFV